MNYSDLVKYYKELGATTKRLEKIEILSNLFKNSDEDDLDLIVYLIQGSVFPEWDERKIGFSSRLILKAINYVTGVNQNDIEKLWKTKGDLGLVVEEIIKGKRQTTLYSKSLDIKKVFDNIRKLAELEGEGTVNKKVQLVSELLSNANPTEAKFIVRTILEELRVGVKEGIIRDAISKAFNVSIQDVEDAFNLTVDYGEVAKLAKKNKLDNVSIKVGKPTKLMLAILVKDINEGFEAVGKPLQAEFKLDGFRLAIHKNKKDNIKLFTRRMEDVTKQFPDVVSVIKEHVNSKEFIIDCEVVGIDKNTGKYLAFQSISQRIKRKYDIEKISKEFPVEVDIFDIIYDGKNLMKTPLLERRKILEKIVKEKKGKVVLTKKLVSDNEKQLNNFFKESLKSGNEGLMLKNVNSLYIPGRYVNGWCKLKNVLEPLDLVIIGAEYGEGKRTGFLSSFIVACKSKDKFLECGMVSTGVKEKENEEGITYNEMTKLLKPLVIKEDGKRVYVKPQIIIEVGYEEIQKSPTYSSGYALRFPKFLSLRNDKPLSEINTINDVEKIYKMQRGKR